MPHPVFQEVGHALAETGDATLDDAAPPRLANHKIDGQALKARLAEPVTP